MSKRLRGHLTKGAHYYNGRRNSRGQRLQSKILHGVQPIRPSVWAEVERLGR